MGSIERTHSHPHHQTRDCVKLPEAADVHLLVVLAVGLLAPALHHQAHLHGARRLLSTLAANIGKVNRPLNLSGQFMKSESTAKSEWSAHEK